MKLGILRSWFKSGLCNVEISSRSINVGSTLLTTDFTLHHHHLIICRDSEGGSSFENTQKTRLHGGSSVSRNVKTRPIAKKKEEEEDRVDRDILYGKLEKMGIRGRMLRMIKEIYRETKNEVITEEGVTEGFITGVGVRQGCPLSPSLFNVYIGRFVKMAMGVSLRYIWELEAGRGSMEIDEKGDDLGSIVKMGEERWPKICLREEIRGIWNRNATKWGQKMEKAFRESGDGEVLKIIWEEGDLSLIHDKMEKIIKTKRDQEVQGNWSRVDRSTYCEGYKKWKTVVGRERYWELKEIKGEIKEQWARIRCGNVGKGGNKGFEETVCTFCNKKEEVLEHILVCKETRKKIKKEWVEGVEKIELGDGNIGRLNFEKCLRGKPNENLCNYVRAFEKNVREKEVE